MNITIVGTGNVGTALAKRLYEKGHKIVQLYSRHFEKTAILAEKVGAVPCKNLSEIKAGADIYLLAVHDDAIVPVTEALNVGSAMVAHTSGATTIDVFEGRTQNYGVFYPLQTFSAAYPPSFEELPMCIGANSEAGNNLLTALAESICPNVYHITEAHRQTLHVAAVFVNNFSNRLFAVASEICETQGLDFNILLPLIRQTVRKIESTSPALVQTGPAARGDQGTIERHIQWLETHADQYIELYKVLTGSVLKNN